jgi:hypothetical protein
MPNTCLLLSGARRVERSLAWRAPRTHCLIYVAAGEARSRSTDTF